MGLQYPETTMREIHPPCQTFSSIIGKGKHTLVTPSNTSIATADIYILIKHKIPGLFAKNPPNQLMHVLEKCQNFTQS